MKIPPHSVSEKCNWPHLSADGCAGRTVTTSCAAGLLRPSWAPREPRPRLCAPTGAPPRTRSHSDSGSDSDSAESAALGRKRWSSASGCGPLSEVSHQVGGPATVTRAPRIPPAPGAAPAAATRPAYRACRAYRAGSCS